MNSGINTFRSRLKLSQYYTDMPGPKTLELQRTWLYRISVFSGLQLTHESDRLAALSGLAANVRHAEFGHYVAGIWLGMLPEATFYCVQNLEGVFRGDIASPDPKGLRSKSPSWLWASIALGRNNIIICHVNLQDTPLEACRGFKLLKTSYTLISKTPYGWAENAKPILRARCMSSVPCTAIPADQ
jgi:hypothetical protein